MSKTLLKTFNIKNLEILKMMEDLQENGVNISHLCREAIRKAHTELTKSKESEESNVSQ